MKPLWRHILLLLLPSLMLGSVVCAQSTSGTDFLVAFPPTEGTPFVWLIGQHGYTERHYDAAETVATIHSDSLITVVAGRRLTGGRVSDLSSVLPVSSLADEYRVQGNWFTVVAAEDGTVVEFDEMRTPQLNAGQAFTFHSDTSDLSGMSVRAIYGQPIALFNGYDQLYEQALPTVYWSNMYAVTATKSKSTDIIGVQALADHTTVYINDSAVYTFDFAVDGHYYWQFAYGDSVRPDTSRFSLTECVLSTSCPAIVHRFTVDSVHANGKDTIAVMAMNRLTAIDRGTPEVGFIATGSGTEFVNIVTPIDNVPYIRLARNGRDTLLYPGSFNQLGGSNTLSAARVLLPPTDHPEFYRIYTTAKENYTMLATIYGVGESEYRYTGFEAIAPFRHLIYINDSLYCAEMSATPICTDDFVQLRCTTNYPVMRYTWDFGDGTPHEYTPAIRHRYTQGGVYTLQLVVERDPMAICDGIMPTDTLRFTVRKDYYRFTMDSVMHLCGESGEDMYTLVYYTDVDGIRPRTNPMVTIGFDEAAHRAGFDERKHLRVYDRYMHITLPDPLPIGEQFGITLHTEAECRSGDTTFYFLLTGDPRHVLIQRYDYLLAIDPAVLNEGDIYNITWERDSVYIGGEHATFLNRFADDRTGRYRVCFVQNGTRRCSCYRELISSEQQPDFDEQTPLIPTTAKAGSRIFVNANTPSHADWYTIGGLLLGGTHTIPAGGVQIETPAERGVYILHVYSQENDRRYKILIQ